MNKEPKYFVYTLEDSNGVVFYVGKGCGDRIKQHVRNAKKGVVSPLYDKIREIWQSGESLMYNFHFKYLLESEAYKREAELIREYGLRNLLNAKSGNEYAVKVPLMTISGDNVMVKKSPDNLTADDLHFLSLMHDHRACDEIAKARHYADEYRRRTGKRIYLLSKTL